MDMGHDEEHEQRGLNAGLGSVAGVAFLPQNQSHLLLSDAGSLQTSLPI